MPESLINQAFWHKTKVGVLDSPIKLFNTPTIVHLVEVTGFEPAASSSRTKRSTKLSHTSEYVYFLAALTCSFFSISDFR